MVKCKLEPGWDTCSKEGCVPMEAKSILGQPVPHGMYCGRCGAMIVVRIDG